MKKTFFAAIIFMIGSYSFAQNKYPAVGIIKKVSAEDVKVIMDTTSVPMIVNFWATWCGPCIREIAWFDSIVSRENSQQGSRIKLLLVSVDFPTAYPGQLTAFVKKQGYKGEVVFLNETNTHHYVPVIDKKWTGEIPASIFINKPQKYYQLFNQQLPPKRFEVEVGKLVGSRFSQ
jgi:thiol-disulfide isomerase/thioredoxin